MRTQFRGFRCPARRKATGAKTPSTLAAAYQGCAVSQQVKRPRRAAQLTGQPRSPGKPQRASADRCVARHANAHAHARAACDPGGPPLPALTSPTSCHAEPPLTDCTGLPDWTSPCQYGDVLVFGYCCQGACNDGFSTHPLSASPAAPAAMISRKSLTGLGFSGESPLMALIGGQSAWAVSVGNAAGSGCLPGCGPAPIFPNSVCATADVCVHATRHTTACGCTGP